MKYVQQGSEVQPFIIDSTEKFYADTPAESTADDLDSDGMPNAWETANGLNPDDASDAASDFDRDGLTALQEYQHGTSPLGQWTREILDLTAIPSWVEWLYPVGINDRGSVLLSGGGNDPATGTYRNGSWLRTKDGQLHAITHPDATYLHANDLNASDEVVGQAYDADWNRLPFFWSAETGWKDFETPSNVVGPVYPYRINAWGDVLLYDASWKNVLVDADGTVFDTLEDDWTSAQITDINDFREAIGTFTNPADGLSYTFLKAGDFSFATNMPASYPDLESYENFYSWTGMMNNYGEFAGNYYAWGQNASENGSFFYDGEYELFESSSTSYNYVVAVNEAPQLLIYSYTYENNTHEVQFSLKHGSVEVAMGQLVPAEETWQHTYYQAINNRGETVGYARLQDKTTEVFIDRPDQDRDADGISDDWESYYGLNPDDATDANLDPDGDGISNLGEYRLRRDPNNQDTQSGETGQVADTRPGIDTDGDGMPNVWEIHHGLDWENPADASQDPDRDGYSSLQEFHLGTTPVGNPTYKIEIIAPNDVSNVYNARLNDNGRVVANGTLPSGTTGGFIWDNATGAQQFTELERPSDSRSYLYSQSENGDVFAGQLQETGDTNRMLPAIWRGNQIPATHDLTGMTQGLIQALSTDGRFALGKAYVNNKWKPIIINEAGILTQLPITGAAQLGYSPLSIHQDGHAAGDLYYSGHGYDPVIWHRSTDSNTWAMQRLPAKTSSAIQLSRTGELIAVWRAHSGNKYPVRVWTTADGVVDLGTLGGRYTQVKAINNTGAFVGYSQAPDANSSNDLYKAFIGRRDTSGNWAIVPLATDLGHTSYAHSLNDQGEIVGNYYDGTTTTPVIWKGVGNRHDLNLQSNAAVDGYKLTGATTINNRGEIIAQATKDGAYFQVVLRPDSDTDNDGIPDKMENQLGLNPFDANDASSDPDADDLTNLEEFRNKTNPFLADTDTDGMPDGWEILWGLDALDPANATGDPDRDHVTNLQEYQTGTSPTGLYRMNVLEDPQLSDLRYAYVRATNTNGDLLIQGSPHTGGTRHILGVKQDDTFTYHTIPALAPGKNIQPREVTASGRVIGTAQDASGIYRLVSWAPGETTLTQHNIPRDTSQSWLSIYDISANGEFILAYWKNPEGQTGQGLIRLDETGTTTVEQFGISTSQSLPNGYYSRWFSRVTNDGLLIGTEEFYDYTENTSESEILLLDPIAGEINIPLPKPENESETETETQQPNSYSYTWPTGNPLADGTQLLTRATWTDNIHTETHLLDTENGTTNPIAYPLKGYSYPVGISDAGTMAAQGENMHGHLISQGQSLNLSALRILGNQSAFLADPATLPRADQLHPGLRLTPSLISETGTIAGSSHPNTSDGNAIIWTVTEVLDSDIDGMADDWEKYHASQLLALIDLTTITAEAAQQLQSGNLTATTDYDGDGKTAGERYQIAKKDTDGDGITDEWELANGLNPNDPSDAKADADGDGITNLQEANLGFDPNTPDPTGPVNLGFDDAPLFEEDTSFRDDHPSDLYQQNGIRGWQADIGDHIELWDEGDGNPYVELQSHWGAHGVKQTFPMLSGTRITFILRYKGRYYWDVYDNAFDLKVEGAAGLTVDDTPVAEADGVRSHAFMETDDGEQWAEWHYASISVTASDSGTGLSDITISLEPKTTESGSQDITHGAFIDLLPVDIVPDYNRDGMINDEDSGKASEETPFVFWINDDDDENEEPHYGDVPSQGVDNDDDVVNGERDLVDFFPVQLRMKKLLEVLPADKYSYRISHPTGALNFIEMPGVHPDSQRINGAGAYLADESWAAEAMARPLNETAGNGTELTLEYLNAVKNGMGVLLFESKAATNQSFELVIFKKSDNSGMARVKSEAWMNLVPVEDMFWSVNIRGAIQPNYTPPAIEVAQNEKFRESRKDRWFVFCHGYNVGEQAARGWNAETFKRLHHMGSDSKFLGVTWEGNQGQIGGILGLFATVTPDYWHNAYNAFRSSSALKDIVNGLSGGNKVIAGHSLGNMLVSSSICDQGLNAEQYFMLNAAVAREAYSAGHVNDDRNLVRHPNWANLATRLWSTDYWTLFPANDGRRKLTWQGRFSTLATKTSPHNYYSTGEEVLKSGDGTKPNLFTDVTIRDQLAWVKQEMGKGSFTKKLASGVHLANGGWAFNNFWGGNPPAQNDPLKANPYFKPFTEFFDQNGQNPQSIHGANGSTLANDYAIRSFLLGHDLPALSNPAGSNETNGFSLKPEDTNTDMPADLKNGNWGDWKHSDLKNEPMGHVWKLFSDMVSRGKLNKNFIPPPTN